MVTKRRKWYENKIRSVFGYVKVTEVDDYYVFYAEKRAKNPLVKRKKKDVKEAATEIWEEERMIC